MLVTGKIPIKSKSHHYKTLVDLIPEEALNLFYQVVEQTQDSIFITDKKGVITFVNQAFENLTGYPREKVLGKTPSIITSGKHQSKVYKTLWKTILSGKPYRAVIINEKKNGEFFYVDHSITAIKDNQGEITHFVGVWKDISERMQAEEEHHKLAAIVSASDDAIYGRDPEGIITSWNQGAEKLYGYSAKEAMGTNVKIIFPKDKQEEYQAILEVIKMGERIDHLETVRKRQDGREIDVSVSISPIFDSSGKLMGSSVIDRDITTEKELERRKDVFISMASHELKTPLTTLKVLTHILQKKINPQISQESAHYLGKIDDQLNKLINLVEDLLDLSKIQTGKLQLSKQIFDLNTLIHETVEDITNAYDSHQIVIEGSCGTSLKGDKDRLNQVLTNLLINAIKYSPKNSQVKVKILPDTNKVTVAVEDFGIGISKTHQLRIFDRFYRAAGHSEKTYPGLGIGLCISAEIIRRHGGKLWVQSLKRKGSTFSFSLPLK